MKAVLMSSDLGGRGAKFRVAEVPAPSPGPGELVVDMKDCGLCGTDLEKMKGEYTAAMPILGHEAVGVVAEVGEGVLEFKPGDRVFPHHHVPCHECHYCRSGSESMCESYRTSNLHPGGFADSFRVPRWNVDKGGVLRLPEGLEYGPASLVEPVACCIRGVDKVRPQRGEVALVSGAGPVGLSHALILRSMGVEVMVSDVSERRLSFAERLGIGKALDAASGSFVEDVKGSSEGRGVDFAIVASGSPKAIIQALRSVRRGGRVCLFGIPQKGSVLDYDISDVYNSEVSVLTSYGATEVETPRALEMVARGSVGLERLITHTYTLDRFGEAVEVATSGEGMKVLLTP